MKNRVAVLLDDHLLFAESFSLLLEKSNTFSSLYWYTSEAELVRSLIELRQKEVYLFLDYYLTEGNVLKIINEAKRINRSLKIIIISSVISPSLISNILTYHPNGFLSKTAGFDEVLECIAAIGKKQTFLSPVLQKILVENKDTLNNVPFTNREIETLQLFEKGYSIEKTASAMNISQYTVLAHRRNMMSKAGCSRITELLAFGKKLDLI